MTSQTKPWWTGVCVGSPSSSVYSTSVALIALVPGWLKVIAKASGSRSRYESGAVTWITCTCEACRCAIACAYFSAVSEPGEKSVARRMFFKESEMAGSRVFMMAPSLELILLSLKSGDHGRCDGHHSADGAEGRAGRRT